MFVDSPGWILRAESRPLASPHRISLRLAARLLRLPLKGGVIALGARASRPHPVPLAAAELQRDAAGSHPVGGNSIGQADRRAMAPFPVDPSVHSWVFINEMAELQCEPPCPVPGEAVCAGGTPALPGSRHPMTSSHQGHQIAEAFWCRLSLKEVHLSSCLFVFLFF